MNKCYNEKHVPGTGGLAFRQYLLPYLLLVVVHIIVVLKASFPSVLPDEFSFLVTARYLSGFSMLPDLGGQAIRPFGYPLLIAPLYWFFSDPLDVYHAATILNCFTISLLYFPIFFLLNRILKYSFKVSSLTAFATALYPAFIANSMLILSENAFIPLYPLVAVCFWLLCTKRSIFYASLFGLLVPLLYAVHGRAYPVVLIAILFICLLVFLKIVTKLQWLVATVLIAAGYLVVELVNIRLATMGSAINHSVLNLLDKLLTLDGWEKFAIGACGQAWYLTIATYGLFIGGIFFAVNVVWNRGRQTIGGCLYDPTSLTILFILATSLGMFIASILNIAGVAVISPNWIGYIYGRYNEGFLAIFIAFGLLSLYRHSDNPEVKYPGAAFVSIILYTMTLTLFVLHGVEIFANIHDPGSSLLGIGPWFIHGTATSRAFLGILAVTIIWLILWVCTRWNYSAGVIFIIGMFCIGTTYAYGRILGREGYIEKFFNLSSQVRFLGLSSKYISYDMDSSLQYPSGTAFITGLQFLLPEANVTRFYSRRDELPGNPVVISSKNWQAAKGFHMRPFMDAYETDHVIWILEKGSNENR